VLGNRIGELRVVGVLHEILDASIDGVLIRNRHVEVTVSRPDVQAVDLARRLRRSRDVAIGLLFQVVYAGADALQEFCELRAEIWRPFICLADIVEIF